MLWDSLIEIPQGAHVNIYAPSGSGKSSLFQLLLGSPIAHRGTLSYCGTALKDMSIESLSDYRNNDISFVAQDLRLFEELSVLENIAVASANQKESKSLNLEKALVDLKLGSKQNIKLSELSQGEKQRVAILRALSKEHQCLILDEPFSHLDDVLTAIAWSMIKDSCVANNRSLILLSLEKEDNHQWTAQWTI